MNEKGFGITAVLAFAAFSLVAIFVFYNFITNTVSDFFSISRHVPNYHNEYSVYSKKTTTNISNSDISNTNYSELEKVVVDAAQNYMMTYYNDIYGKDVLYISITSLEQMSYLVNLNDGHNKCTGYIKVLKTNNLLEYIPYLRCGYNYTTYGYEASLDK